MAAAAKGVGMSSAYDVVGSRLEREYPLLIRLYHFSKKLAPFIGDPGKFRAFVEAGLLLRRDSLTDLMTRGEWMRALNEQIARLYPYTQHWEGAAPEDIFKSLSVDFAPGRLWFIAGDVANLALANKYGHAKGDKYLGSIAQVLRDLESKDVYPGRLGGDEFSLLVMGSEDAATSAHDAVLAGLRPLTLDVLGVSLPARLDLGEAHFGEALEIFREFIRRTLQAKDAKNDELLSTEPVIEYHTLVDIFLRLADQRADLSKMQRGSICWSNYG